MGKNNPIKKIFKKSLVGLILVGSLVSPLSCKLNYEEPAGPNSERDKFNISTDVYIIYEGDSVVKMANVYKNREYKFHIHESNDGPRDTISVYADGVKLGEHLSPDVLEGGDGWYEPEASPSYKFKSNSEEVELMIHVDKADSYGYWPQWFEVEVLDED